MVARNNSNTSSRPSALDVVLASDSTQKTLSGLGTFPVEIAKTTKLNLLESCKAPTAFMFAIRKARQNSISTREFGNMYIISLVH
jgi:hypothetical protein